MIYQNQQKLRCKNRSTDMCVILFLCKFGQTELSMCL
jgi:hypothetical protein